MGLLLTLVYVRDDRDKVYDGTSLPRRSLFTLTLKRLLIIMLCEKLRTIVIVVYIFCNNKTTCHGQCQTKINKYYDLFILSTYLVIICILKTSF